nr:MAG TPA: hypothetical protein [Caudoviricetes sp.]
MLYIVDLSSMDLITDSSFSIFLHLIESTSRVVFPF